METQLLATPGSETPVPAWTREQFLYTTEPFDWLYQFRNNKFLLSQYVERVKDRAGAVGVRTFMRLWKSYLEAIKQQSGMILDNATQFTGQAFELHCGEYTADDDGITILDKMGYEILVCPHPIMPVLRLVNIDTGEEKLKIAFRKGDVWRTMVVDKDTLASAGAIVSLAKYGVMVNSETAKHLVRYFTTLEALNYDCIEEISSVGRLGWIEGQGFSPYVEGLEFDGSLSFRHAFESVRAHGSYETWLAAVREIRRGGTIARILLAASFASVLVEPCDALPFFVHLWGGTEAGKTVGLMLAASVWASPKIGDYISTFNSTGVAQELWAGFVNSLPLCLDELQIQADRRDFDKTIYMLSEGVGRSRGAKTGGLQKLTTWKNCILTTGEMPISNGSSGGGAVNRIVEIDCKDEKLFRDPRGVVKALCANYGFAGRTFVELLQAPDKLEYAVQLQSRFHEQLQKGESTEKQAIAASLILAADQLIEEWIFRDGQTLSVGDIEQYLSTKAEVSQNERALEWLYDFIAQNNARFTPNQYGDYAGEIWGCVDTDYIYFIKSAFDKAMRDNGFNAASFLSWAKRKGIILCSEGHLTRLKRIRGLSVASRCVCLVVREEASLSEKSDGYAEIPVGDLPFD